MQWLDRSGPFWDEERRHGGDVWLECGEDVVTDTAVGEVAYRVCEGEECALASARPGSWDFSPVPVTLGHTDEVSEARRVDVENWRDPGELRQRLESSEPPVASWGAMKAAATRRFPALRFSGGCFDALRGIPFNLSSAQRVLHLLRVLGRLAAAFDTDGKRTTEGNHIHGNYFVGRTAPFSDSSEKEKLKFRNELTFPHLDAPGRTLFCPWHGKEHHLLLRLHFSWPIQAGEPVYVVYVGRKLTAR